MQHVEFNASKTDYPENCIVYTTLPPQNLGTTRADCPDGWAECLFRGPSAKRAVLSTPGFPSSIPRPDKPSYRICETPTSGGLGVVATRNLKMGDLIMSERPLFVTCHAASAPVAVPDDTPMGQRIQAIITEWEKMLEGAFNRMSEENKAAFKALANGHTEDGSGPILGVIRTNGFGILLGQDEKEESRLHCVIYDHLSRVNHGCTPNSSHSFSVVSFSGQLRAVRDIKKGEEIFVNYCDLNLPTAARQKYLEPYGFQCACPSCTDPHSDCRRNAILDSAEGLGQYHRTGSRDEEVRRLEESLSWLGKIEEEGLQKLNVYEKHMEAVVRSSMFLGKMENLVKYGPLRSAWKNATSGDPNVLMLF
jgi:SET domain